MAGRKRNLYRKAAMVKFGKTQRGKFRQRTLQDYMNSYIGTNGRINKHVQVSQFELTMLLRYHMSFRYIPEGQTTETGWWIYIEEEEE